DEELFEYAMHPEQYENFRSGKAKAEFEKDLEKRKAAKAAPASAPSVITVNLGGKTYKLDIAYGDTMPAASQSASAAPAGEGEPVAAPLSGKFFLTKDPQETPRKVGDAVKRGDVLCYIEAMKIQNAVCADKDGVVTAILASNGDSVEEDDVIMKFAPNK
ncbi:MAG: oxaloacetate decarboxylase, partial [Bacteroidales bacterium]|nr:oxaloacetate decarboxylase [Bacteroidales bacterium]